MLGRAKRAVLQKLATSRGWLSIEEGQRPYVYDYKKYLKPGPSKRALLSYLPNFVIDEAAGLKTSQFSNVGLALTLPKVLNNLGYSVDIVSWDDTTFKPNKKYDLFIGHGAKNFELLHNLMQPKPLTIYFSTGSYWRFHNEQEDMRLAGFKKRHHVELPRDRYIYESEELANKAADAIICLGNEDAKQTYLGFPAVYSLPIACYPEVRPLPEMTAERRQSFIFFSGGGNIHKGLDLVLDAFEGSQNELYICSILDPEFETYYKDLLYHSPNIHYVGLVEPRSQQFYEVMDKCAFTILPSCSEGSPGSVVECMQQGLVPIVSNEAHIDVADFGITLNKTNVETIKAAVEKSSEIPIADLRLRSKKSRRSAQNYSIEKFESNLEAIFTKISAEVL